MSLLIKRSVPRVGRFLVGALTLAMLLGFSRCGGAKTGEAGKVKVSFWHAMGGPLGDALEQMIADFETANPDVDVVPVSMANYSSLSQKLMAAVQVNDPPNIAQMYESWTAQFHSLGKLVVLDSLIRGADGFSDAELADFYPAFIEGNTWDGRIVTLPFNKSLPVFFYNAEMLAAAGYSEFPKTWPEFRQMIRRLSDPGSGRWGCAGLVNEGMFGTMLRQKGGDYFDSTGSQVTFNSRIGVEVAEFIAALVNRDSSVYYGAGYEPQNDFLAGKIACLQSTSVSWSFMKPNMQFRVGIAPLPVWDRADVISFGTNIGIFRKGTPEQIRAAWRFIKWFTSPEQQAKWAELTFYVPVRRSSLQVESYARLV
ncbi:MAG: ABC transporter substrate-binding protein, partial [candidate division WOR-3 bacterium]